MKPIRILLAVIFGFMVLAAISAQQPSVGIIGWYNGEWQSGIPGLANWYEAPDNYSRVYDSFEVPAGGWTVTAVFSDNALYDFPPVAFASWEIRTKMSPGHGGKVVAAGNSRATVKADPSVTTAHYPSNEVSKHFRIQVDGLKVQLPAGRYWVSVAPMGQGQSILHATLGKNAIGTDKDHLGIAFFRSVSVDDEFGESLPRPMVAFVPVEDAVPQGQGGMAQHFSQGVLIAK
jgi:hypothetical protein